MIRRWVRWVKQKYSLLVEKRNMLYHDRTKCGLQGRDELQLQNNMDSRKDLCNWKDAFSVMGVLKVCGFFITNWSIHPLVFFHRCSTEKAKAAVLTFLPILTWLPSYPVKQYLLSDVVSGLSTGVVQLPQGQCPADPAALLFEVPFGQYLLEDWSWSLS